MPEGITDEAVRLLPVEGITEKQVKMLPGPGWASLWSRQIRYH